MLTIELKGLKFYAYHGVYEAEKTMGGPFEVDVLISHTPPTIPVQHLSETIDYTAIYQLVSNIMQKPTPLLETLVSTIATAILTTFSTTQEVSVRVKKLQPPLIGFAGEVAISFVMNRTMLS